MSPSVLEFIADLADLADLCLTQTRAASIPLWKPRKIRTSIGSLDFECRHLRCVNGQKNTSTFGQLSQTGTLSDEDQFASNVIIVFQGVQVVR